MDGPTLEPGLDTGLDSPAWIRLDGAVNVRDVAGLPTRDGRHVRPGVLIRSDNLQDLTERDVAELVERYGVRTIADLRTGVEVRSTGPHRLHADPRVEIAHLSLFPERGEATDVAATDDVDGPPVLPWQDRDEGRSAGQVYLGYLTDRPDSVLTTLRMIAHSDGATVVHCAAGKDRTGTVVALALDAVGVERTAIVEDYARSAERIEAIIDRLRTSRTYAGDIGDSPAQRHAPRPETMQGLLEVLQERFAAPGMSGAEGFLRTVGWTDDDQAALERRLLE